MTDKVGWWRWLFFVSFFNFCYGWMSLHTRVPESAKARPCTSMDLTDRLLRELLRRYSATYQKSTAPTFNAKVKVLFWGFPTGVEFRTKKIETSIYENGWILAFVCNAHLWGLFAAELLRRSTRACKFELKRNAVNNLVACVINNSYSQRTRNATLWQMILRGS